MHRKSLFPCLNTRLNLRWWKSREIGSSDLKKWGAGNIFGTEIQNTLKPVGFSSILDQIRESTGRRKLPSRLLGYWTYHSQGWNWRYSRTNEDQLRNRLLALAWLIFGSGVLAGLLPEYDTKRNFKQSDHTLRIIWKVID